MPRKSTAAVRAALPLRRQPGAKVTVVDGLNARAVSEIHAMEVARMWPGAVAQALAKWKRTVHQDMGRLFADAHDLVCPCCDPFEPRSDLETAMRVLSPQASRALRAKVEPLDELYRRKTIEDPYTPPEWPWWQRRA